MVGQATTNVKLAGSSAYGSFKRKTKTKTARFFGDTAGQQVLEATETKGPTGETPGSSAVLAVDVGGISTGAGASLSLDTKPLEDVASATTNVFEAVAADVMGAAKEATETATDAFRIAMDSAPSPMGEINETTETIGELATLIGKSIAPRTTAAVGAAIDSSSFTLDASFGVGGSLNGFFDNDPDFGVTPKKASEVRALLAQGATLIYGSKMTIRPKMNYTTAANGVRRMEFDYASLVTTIAQAQDLSEEFVGETMRYGVIESVVVNTSNKTLSGKMFSSPSQLHVFSGKMNHMFGIGDVMMDVGNAGDTLAKRVIADIHSMSGSVNQREIFMFRGTAPLAAEAIAGRFTSQRLSAALAASSAEAAKQPTYEAASATGGRSVYYFRKNTMPEYTQLEEFILDNDDVLKIDRHAFPEGVFYYASSSQKKLRGKTLDDFIAMGALRRYEAKNSLYAPIKEDAPSLEYGITHFDGLNNDDTTLAVASSLKFWPVVAINASAGLGV